jgi:uncharacterized membrane protein YdjX (TVP38/TMEM64 family)
VLNRRAIVAAVLVAAAVTSIAMLGDRLDLGYLQQRHAALVAICRAHPAIASLAYFSLFVLASAISLPAAGLLMVAAGALFGFGLGLPLAAVSSTAGAAVSFLLSRYLLRDWIKHRFGEWLAAVDDGVSREGGFYVFAMRMIPAIPFFVINPVMGLTALPLRHFVVATFVGLLPAMALLVFAGTRLAELKSVGDVLDAPLVVALTLLGTFPLLARRLLSALRRARR